MQNKKGQDVSITTIIVVVLGIAVLVLLILGFTTGWSNMLPWLSGSNIDTIRTQCQTACMTDSSYDFCQAKKTVKDENGVLQTNTGGTVATLTPQKQFTCYELSNPSEVKAKNSSADSDTDFVNRCNSYSISSCPTVDC